MHPILRNIMFKLGYTSYTHKKKILGRCTMANFRLYRLHCKEKENPTNHGVDMKMMGETDSCLVSLIMGILPNLEGQYSGRRGRIF